MYDIFRDTPTVYDKRMFAALWFNFIGDTDITRDMAFMKSTCTGEFSQ